MTNQKRNNLNIKKTGLLILVAAIFISVAVSCSGYSNSQTDLNTADNRNSEDTTFGNSGTNELGLEQGSKDETTEEQYPTQQLAHSNSFDSNLNLAQLFEAFWTSRELLQDNFFEQPVDDRTLAAGALNGLEEFLKENNISISDIELPTDSPTAESTAKKANTPKDLIELFLPFWETWNKLPYLELPEGTSPTTMMRQALSGMIASLDDPYTNYRDPDLSERRNTTLSGEYEGIGAWVDVEAEYLTVVSPIQGTPAEKAGLLPGDQIIAVDGVDMTGVDPNIALKRVVGQAGTKVILTLAREGVDPFDVEIIREKITIPLIETEMLEGGIAYLKLIRFYTDSDLDVNNALKELLAQNPKGLIFDLRGNGGGFLHTVVNISSEFITEGNILIEEFSDGYQRTFPVTDTEGIATEIPLVVLIDQGSASASEIFAGAIKDYQRGILVGQTSFGKGLVQLPVTLPENQGSLTITIARWFTPNGTEIQEIGIDPDYFIEYTQDDFDQGLDPQLQKAIELLTTGQ